MVPKIYFYTFPSNSIIHDDLIPLAEGFKELGIPFYANANYWRLSPETPEYLINHTPEVHPTECDIIIFPYNWFYRIEETTYGNYSVKHVLPDDSIWATKGIKVCFDFHDGYKTFSFLKEFRKFDYIFRCKYNNRCYHPGNHIAWQLGLTNRMIHATQQNSPFLQRHQAILWNFGASHPYLHGLRKLAKQSIYPLLKQQFIVNEKTDNLQQEDPKVSVYDQLMWKQAARRHNPHYYERLRTHMACAAFCGEIIPGLPLDPSIYLIGGNKAKLLHKAFDSLSKILQKAPRSIQWDSWRFWEALAAGCVPIHVDLEKYGVQLPVMPYNWKHYIGIDLNNIDDAIDRMKYESTILENISYEGHKWVMENYSPKPTAKRFLQILGYQVTDSKND